LAVTVTGDEDAPEAKDSDVGETTRLLPTGGNTVARTDVALMPFVPFTIRLPQDVNVVLKFWTMSRATQQPPLPDQDQPR
jgi:hypothetical protein